MGPVLGTQPEPEVHQHEHPAHDPEQQGVPQPGGAHQVAQLRFPAPQLEASAGLLAPLGPEHILRQHRRPAGGALAQGPVDQLAEFANVAGEVVGLQPFHQGSTHLGRGAPAQAAGLLAHAVAQPFAQVLAAHPQRRHPNRPADRLEAIEVGFGGEVDPTGKWLLHPVGAVPAAFQGQLPQARKKGRIDAVHLVDQEPTGAEGLHQRQTIGPRREQLGTIGAEQGAIEAHQQLLACRRAVVDQGGDVVLLQAGLPADQHRRTAGIGGGGADHITQLLGIAAAAHDPPPHPAQQVRSQAPQVGGRGGRVTRRVTHQGLGRFDLILGAPFRRGRSWR